MFCPKCGKTVNDGLKFCNGCGERLGRGDVYDDTPTMMLGKILQTLSVTSIFSLGVLIGLVAVLLGNNVKPEIVGVIVFAYLATVFGICFTLIRQIPKLIDARITYWNARGDNDQSAQITAQPSQQLNEYRSPVMSVTEHTTRTLANVPTQKG
jgi:hypothetical protein